jgi:hypothetical protein
MISLAIVFVMSFDLAKVLQYLFAMNMGRVAEQNKIF